MAIYRAMKKARDDRDFEAMSAFMHDDCVFVRHQSGTTVTWDEFKVDFKVMMENGGFDRLMDRCIYENEDILVEHAIMRFGDGTRESVILVQTLENGQLERFKTGASRMD